METMDTIRTRRSIRDYLTKSIEEQKVEMMLAAGMQAPSAGNQQAWQFVVIDDRQLLDKIAVIHPYATMCRQAPLAIMVCGDLRLEKHRDYWVQDCSAATQNMLLTACDLGLGAVWAGIYPRQDRVEAMKTLLKLPEQVIPLSLVVVGYPARPVEPINRFRADRVHRNGW